MKPSKRIRLTDLTPSTPHRVRGGRKLIAGSVGKGGKNKSAIPIPYVYVKPSFRFA